MPEKKHPFVYIGTALGSLAFIAGNVVFVDSRYAHAEDLNKVAVEYKMKLDAQQSTFNKTLNQMRLDNAYTVDQLRKKQIEDKLFEYDLIDPANLNAVQKAIRLRYEREAQDIDKRWAGKAISSEVKHSEQ